MSGPASGHGQETPFFSVVIAAYNAAAWIVPTIHAALKQTYREREVIVIGDGCTDRTGDIVTANFGDAVLWKNLDRNWGGQSFPNNEGIRLARGTHVAYLGHDDIWSPRHLESLASLIRARNPDFAVSGAVYHAPPGSRYYHITGIFDDPRAAERDFFPPSSVAHRREVVERIGLWRDPNEISAPADCEFLLRAARAKCSFASTRAITVHKFAAGHRYLSYRFPSGAEQERMLERLSAPGGEARVLQEIHDDIAAGADNPPMRHANFDRFGAGVVYRRNRRAKGLERVSLTKVDKPLRLAVERFPAALDWYELEEDPRHGPFRWSGPNPNPRYLLNVRSTGTFALRIRILAFAADDLVEPLKLEVNEREVPLARECDGAGTYLLTSGPLTDTAEDGLVLRFRLPRCARLRDDPRQRRAGLALSSIEILPLG
jgi:glycosyltransferase involved in cell wall biosynthesis